MRGSMCWTLPLLSFLIGFSAPRHTQAQHREAIPRTIRFTITGVALNGGASVTNQRGISYRITFTGAATAQYRIRVGQMPDATQPWGSALASPIEGQVWLTGDEGPKKVYVQMRQSASSQPIVASGDITLRWPRKDYAILNERGVYVQTPLESFLMAARKEGFGFSARKVSSTGDACYGPQHGFMTATSGLAGLFLEIVCEFRVLTGKRLQPGWTMKEMRVEPVGSPAGATCQIVSAKWNTDDPAVTIRVRHPAGQLAPGDSYTYCKITRLVLNGPDSPHHQYMDSVRP